MKSRVVAANTIVFTSVLSLTSCPGGDSANSSSSFSPTGSSSNYAIAVVPKDATSPWFVCMETSVNKYAEETGLNVFQKGPAKADVTMQVQIIQNFITQDVDTIGVVPVDPGAIEPVPKEAMDASIVVVTHEGASQENATYDIETFSSAKHGAFIMDNLATVMGEEGTCTTIVGYVTNTSHDEWTDSAIARQKEAHPNMILPTAEPYVESQDNGETAYQVAKGILRKYPEVTGTPDTSSFDASGAACAIDEFGLQGRVFTAEAGVPDANKEVLDKGLVSILTPRDPADADYVMTSLAAKTLDGEKVEGGIDLGPKGYVMHFAESSMKVLEGDGRIQITRNSVDSFGF